MGASWWKTSRMVHRQDDEPAWMQVVARSGGTEVAPLSLAGSMYILKEVYVTFFQRMDG